MTTNVRPKGGFKIMIIRTFFLTYYFRTIGGH